MNGIGVARPTMAKCQSLCFKQANSVRTLLSRYIFLVCWVSDTMDTTYIPPAFFSGRCSIVSNTIYTAQPTNMGAPRRETYVSCRRWPSALHLAQFFVARRLAVLQSRKASLLLIGKISYLKTLRKRLLRSKLNRRGGNSTLKQTVTPSVKWQEKSMSAFFTYTSLIL